MSEERLAADPALAAVATTLEAAWRTRADTSR
jgi:hypothetical protein